MSNTLKKRNSNIEFLRIFSMICIIGSHFAVHGLNVYEISYGANMYIAKFLCVGGKFGVALFMMIAGYFMCDSEFSFKRLLKLWGEVYFYSVVIGLTFLLVPSLPIDVSKIQILQIFFPIGADQYWFMTDYFIIMLLSPLFNMIIKSLDKAKYQIMLMTFTLILCVIPTLSLDIIKFDVGEIGLLILVYFIAGYIKKFVQLDKINSKKHLLIGVGTYLLIYCVMAVMIKLTHNINNVALIHGVLNFGYLKSIFIIICASELFLGAVSMKPKHSTIVNFISASTLGIYLIHDNNFVRWWIWDFLDVKKTYMYSTFSFILSVSLTVIGIFIVCLAIDIVRKYTVEKLYMLALNKHYDSFSDSVSKLCEKIRIKIFEK